MFSIISGLFRRNPVFVEIFAIAKAKIKDIEAKYKNETKLMRETHKKEVQSLKLKLEDDKTALAKDLAKSFFQA